ncbi:MAG: hypothetical protein ACOVOR_02175 [Rhabdochlamydiaceae bacterium]
MSIAITNQDVTNQSLPTQQSKDPSPSFSRIVYLGKIFIEWHQWPHMGKLALSVSVFVISIFSKSYFLVTTTAITLAWNISDYRDNQEHQKKLLELRKLFSDLSSSANKIDQQGDRFDLSNQNLANISSDLKTQVEQLRKMCSQENIRDMVTSAQQLQTENQQLQATREGLQGQVKELQHQVKEFQRQLERLEKTRDSVDEGVKQLSEMITIWGQSQPNSPISTPISTPKKPIF